MAAKVDPARVNLFQFPHKAFRFMWLEVVMEIGNTNFTAEASMQKTRAIIDYAIRNYAAHNADESGFFAPRLKAKGGNAAKVSDEWAAEHDQHVREMNDLQKLFNSIEAEKDVHKRGPMMQKLYENASNFLEEDLKHMRWEETVVMAEFQANFTDEELKAIETEFIKQMDPKHMQELVPIFLRAGNIDDRTRIFFAIKMTAPPQAFEGVLHGLAPTIIPGPELEEIKKRLAGPPPAQP